MLVLVQLAIAAHVENLKEFSWGWEAQKVKDLEKNLIEKCTTYLLSASFENKSDIGFVQDTLLSEIGLANGLPDLLAFPRSSNQGSRLTNQLIDFGSRVIGQGAQSCAGATNA